MMQVKEFLSGQEGQSTKINDWLRAMDGIIKVIDIKYSVSTSQTNGHIEAQAYSGVLVVYKIK